MIMGIQVAWAKEFGTRNVINIEYEICHNFISIMQFNVFLDGILLLRRYCVKKAIVYPIKFCDMTLVVVWLYSY